VLVNKIKYFGKIFLISIAIIYLYDILLYLFFTQFLHSANLVTNFANFDGEIWTLSASFIFIVLSSITLLLFKSKKISIKIIGFILTLFFMSIIFLFFHLMGYGLLYSGGLAPLFILYINDSTTNTKKKLKGENSIKYKLLSNFWFMFITMLIIIALTILLDIIISLINPLPSYYEVRYFDTLSSFETIMKFLLITMPFILLNTIFSEKLIKKIKYSGIKKYLLSNIILILILVVHLAIFIMAHLGYKIF